MSEAAVEIPGTEVPVTTPSATPAVPGAGAGWRDGLSEELRSNPSITKFDTTENLASSYIELQSLVGKKGVIPPGEGDGPEVYERFYNELGRPETVEGYDLSNVEIPEALQPFWDDGLQSAMVAGMHELGMSQATVKGLLNLFAGEQAKMLGELNQGVAQANTAAQDELKTELGTSYDAKVEVSQRAFREAFGDNAGEMAGLELAGGGMLGNHPGIIRAFIKLGESMNEAELLGDKTNTSFAGTPADGHAEIQKLSGDKEFMAVYQDAEHPEHEAAVNRMSAAFAQAYSNEEQP